MNPIEQQFFNDLEKKLWTAADKLRSSLDASVYKHVVLGLIFLLSQNRVDLSGLELKLAAPVFTRPEFSPNALLSVALPLFLITLTGQYMPGMLVLRNDGFKTSANPILTVTGLGSLLMAPFGSHAFNVAAITAAICTGRDTHQDPSKRYIAGTRAKADYDSEIFGVNALAGYTLQLDKQWLLEPQVGARYANVSIDSYREKGSSAALNVGSQRYEIGEMGLGRSPGGRL